MQVLLLAQEIYVWVDKDHNAEFNITGRHVKILLYIVLLLVREIYVAKRMVTKNPESINSLIWNHNHSSFAMDGMEREESGQPGTVEGGYSYTSPEGELVTTFIWTSI